MFVRAGTAWRVLGEHPLRSERATILFAAVALAVAILYAAAVVMTEGAAILLVPPVAAIVVLAIASHPTVGLYILFAIALLFEQIWITGLDPITQTRLYQNLATFTPIPLRFSIVDLLIGLTLASLAAERLRGKRDRLRIGLFGWPVLAYAAVFFLGTAIGIARGGGWNLDAAMNELRGPLTLLLLYLLAVNLIQERRQLAVFLPLFVALVGIKAIQAILNYRDAQALPYSLDAVTSKEDVVFFASAIALGLTAVVLGMRTRIALLLLALQPLLLVAELVSNRRSGFFALGVAIVAILALTLMTRPRRGLVLSAIGASAIAIYVLLSWDASGPVAEPLRALRSVFDSSTADAYDQSSDAWRAIENVNIAYTVQQLPLTGVGLGQEYLFEKKPSALPFLYWQYITHNAILWLWLKAGPLGALALWFLVARALTLCSSVYVRLRDSELRFMIALPITLVASQIVFSSVDLGLSYSRTMMVLGTALGLASFVAARSIRERAEADPQ